MLDIERGININTSFQELCYILVALDMPGAWSVAMRQLVYQDKVGFALQDGINIHLKNLDTPVFHHLARDDLQSLKQVFGLSSSVSLNDADNYIHSLGFALVCGFQHGIGFTDSRGITEKDLEVATILPLLFGLDSGQQLIRIWARVGRHCYGSITPMNMSLNFGFYGLLYLIQSQV